MAGELVHGLAIFVDGNMVAVETTFEDAVATASGYLPTSPSTTKVQIRTTSSHVVAGSGASPVRTWNYDYALKQWVEFLR
jgi:hypothetical protein